MPHAGKPLKIWKHRRVGKKSEEFKNLQQRIEATCSRPIMIESILRVENVALFQSFEIQRKSFMLKFGVSDANVIEVFHGTKNQNVDSISADGFNKSYGWSGTLGRAIYGALHFDTAIKYTEADQSGKRSIFVCRAVAGRPAVVSGKVTLYAPPYIDEDKLLRFTCVKDARMNPKAYAFYEEKQVTVILEYISLVKSVAQMELFNFFISQLSVY